MSIISETDINLVRQFAKESTSMKEFQVKLGYSRNGSVGSVIRNYCKENNISLDHFTGVNKNAIKRTPENTFIENSSATQSTLRKMYINGNYSPYICSICGQEPFWNGKDLTLTLDHMIDQKIYDGFVQIAIGNQIHLVVKIIIIYVIMLRRKIIVVIVEQKFLEDQLYVLNVIV